MMLGLSWYTWDKRCPSGKRCIPPVYGNFGTTSIKVPTNSPRNYSQDQAEAELSAAHHQRRFWKAGIPRGNDVCIKPSSRRNKRDVAPLKKRSNPKQHSNSHHHHQSPTEIFPEKATICVDNARLTLSASTRSLSGCECNGTGGNNKKKFYNVMWDPKIARGPTTVQFEEAQFAKWQRQVDSQRAILFHEQIRKRRKKMMTLEGGYLNPKSNPMRRIIYPTVTITKEPLSFESFAQFLTEVDPEPVEKTNASQVTDDVAPPGQNEKSIHSCSNGFSASVQTDTDCNKRMETMQWITGQMVSKIPEQAVLELVEEAELEIIKTELKKYELAFLYRKWHEMKEAQWNEYLRAWNEIRIREILDQDAHLRDHQERIALIGFCKNGIGSCFHKTLEDMKRDGFINENGVPYEELEELYARVDLQDETEEKYEEQQMLARKVLDSTLINAVVHRFSQHMFDKFGKPHGTWLSKRGRRDTIAYDMELQLYLENRWPRRREYDGESESLHQLYSENSLLNIFDFYHDTIVTPKVRANVKPGQSDTAITGNHISKKDLGLRTGKSTTLPIIKTHRTSSSARSSLEDDVSMLYKRNTRWSKLERDDDEHHHRENTEELAQQKGSSSLGIGEKRGSKLAVDAKRVSSGDGTKGNRVGGKLGGTSARFLGERKEVDSDKLREPDGESEKRRGKLPSLQAKLPKQSQTPHARFE